jgi:tRNA threonylcarbamoyladenosine modification (KEOPS) complex Cgi121 subunit
MEIILVKGFRKYMGISLVKNYSKGDLRNIFDKILSKNNDIVIQCINPKGIAGIKHIYHAVRLTLRAFQRNRSRSKNLSVELLLYLAGRRQINESLKFLGLTSNMQHILIIAISNSKKEVYDSVNNLILTLGEELPLTFLGKEKISNPKYIIDIFSINEEELNATYLNPLEDFKNVLEKLVLERLALFST